VRERSYLLSGFVMTLGYGQSAYADDGCCGGGGAAAGVKSFDRWKFWRNRFARLAPVYYITNLFFLSLLIAGAMPGGVDGTAGLHTVLLGAFLSIFGVNTWLYPIMDVGPPPNPVCWTITTMSFFYWVFPCALPRMQRMTTQERSKWIVIFYWLQAVTYGAGFAWAATVPVLQLEPRNLTDTPRFYFDTNEGNGYWIGRAWPVTRVMVFFMGCLAALNRLEVHEAAENDRIEGAAARQCLADAVQRSNAKGGSMQKVIGILQDELRDNPHSATIAAAIKLGEAEEAAARAQPADAFFFLAGDQQAPPSVLESIVIAGPCGCCRCFATCVSCACCALQTAVGGAQKGKDPPEMWAHRADVATGLYYGSILLIVMASVLISLIFGSDDGFSEPGDIVGMLLLTFGRMGLEPAIVMLELGIIVSLTYDQGAFSYRSCRCMMYVYIEGRARHTRC
jgi:hypothetical protein